MALVKQFEHKQLERVSVHKETDSTYSTFEYDGRKLFQLDTYGSEDRQFLGKKSQSMQFDEQSAYVLFKLLRKHFDFV